jgi:hypothetical protein
LIVLVEGSMAALCQWKLEDRQRSRRGSFQKTLCTSVVVLGLALVPGLARAQQFVQVSVSTAGTPGNAASNDPVISGNGQVVAFTSSATNLVPNDTNGVADVFVRDLTAHTTTRVSVTSAGAEATASSGMPTEFLGRLLQPNVSLSTDGSLVAFTSKATLAPNIGAACVPDPRAAVNSCSDVYVHERSTGQITRVSVASDGSSGNRESGEAQISGDGRFVVFTSSASNLVANDQNGVSDVFVHDRTSHTTTRVSVSASGNDLAAPSYDAHISADGQIVAFVSEAAITSDADPVGCLLGAGASTQFCARAYVLDRNTGTMTRVPLPASVVPDGAAVFSVTLTPNGRFVAMHAETFALTGSPQTTYTVLAVYDRLTQRVESDVRAPGPRAGAVTISDNGRIVSVRGVGFNPDPSRSLTFDRQIQSELPPAELPPSAVTSPLFLSAFTFNGDGLRVAFSDNESHAGTDLNSFNDAYVVMRDQDNDGMADSWEALFSLNSNDPADAALDSDHDGTTNLQEYLAGTNPNGTFKRYFAEGAANAFFSTRFAVFNPGDLATVVTLEFLGSNGESRTTNVLLAAHGWSAVELNDTTARQPDNDFSTVIEADHPVVVDRTMTWDKTGYGSHAETMIEAPETTWYLAEGSTGGAFDLFYLIQNPGDQPANVTVNYLLPAPAAPIVKTYLVAPKSRRTIYVDQEGAELAATDLSAKITADQPILVERAMYYSTPSQPFAAGHEGAAVNAPATSWFLAEGATGSFFDLFVLIANAEATDAQVKVTYLLPDGAPIVKNYPIPAHSRVTINVDGEDPRLVDTPVSTIVESTNTVPVIVERAMWWPSPNWYEAHLSAGATTTGTRWALAEGLVTNTPGSETETYILLANTSATPGNADVTLYFGDGTSLTTNVDLPANSRVNIPVSVAFPTAMNKGGYGTIIQTNGPRIVVERAMYSNANGQTWAAGTDALATKLQ